MVWDCAYFTLWRHLLPACICTLTRNNLIMQHGLRIQQNTQINKFSDGSRDGYNAPPPLTESSVIFLMLIKLYMQLYSSNDSCSNIIEKSNRGQ